MGEEPSERLVSRTLTLFTDPVFRSRFETDKRENLAIFASNEAGRQEWPGHSYDHLDTILAAADCVLKLTKDNEQI